MSQKLFISFQSDPMPDVNLVEDGQEAGRAVFSKIAPFIEKYSETITAMNEWDAYGWYVEVEGPNAPLICMMQLSDEWLVQIWDERSLWDKIRRKKYDADVLAFASFVADVIGKVFQIEAPAVRTEAGLRTNFASSAVVE